MKQAIDFCAYQDVLDPIFHTKDDAYPQGSAEHSEIYQFLTKLDKLHKSRPTPLEPSNEAKAAAEKLGISAAYDARFRVNTSILPGPKRMKRGLRAVQKKADELSAATGIILSADEIVTQYARLLPFYEDFYQKRHIAKLTKLEQDRAALPIAAFQSQIVDAVRNHQAVVIAGNTGCGKSTQVPQYLVNAGFRNVVCTQPRRISAISLCRRVSFETLNVFGSDVAYQVRFNSTVSDSTRVVFMTEGILLRIMASHPQLAQYDVVIVDEVHERHLNTDFLLTLLRALLIQRPDFRVVLMSATINQQMYSDYFGGAPVIQVPGRLYPVELEYIPPPKQEQNPSQRSRSGPRQGKQGNSEPIDPAPYLRLLQRIDSQYPSSHRGDMLVFVAGMSDITRLRDALQPYAQQTQRWIILPLHSALPLKDQDKVFDAAPQGVRKCIISTNIAETSVTIDGIRFVVDSGRAKEMLHDVARGSGTLQEGWISQASAEQRKGRAGRTGPGKCFRMYSKEHYGRMMPFSLPEIRRARLESVVLQIKSLAGGSMDPRHFGFIEPPPEDALEGAIITLHQVGALTKSEELTALGAVLSALPVEVHVGKMLVMGALLNILEPLLTVAAALTVQSPFMRIADDAGPGVRERRRELLSPHGDALTLVHTFEAWLAVKADGRSSTSKWCNRRGLQEQRLYELAKLKRQFQDLLEETGLVHLSGMESRRRQKRYRPMGKQRRQLLELQRMQEHKRTRRVLAAPGEVADEDDGDLGEDGDTDDQESEEEDDELDIDDLEFRLRSRREQMFTNAGRPFSPADIGLLKTILASSLYPRVAIPDVNNHQRREQDARFHTAHLADCVLHPASCLTGSATSLSGQEVLMYTELLETTREYICGNTPCRVVPLLLLAALHIDTNDQATSMLLDGWLLVRFHDDTGALVLRRVVHLRHAVDTLLGERLKGVRIPHLPSPEAFDAASTCTTQPLRGEAGESIPPLAVLLHDDLLSSTRLSEEDVAAELAASVDWPIRYSVERLTGQKVTAQYVHGEVQNITKDLRGVPKQKAGYQVTSWLRVGSLKRFMGERSLHVLQPHLRRHWLCPGCHTPMLGNAAEIQDHVNGCQRALQLPQEVLEEQGYQDGAAAVKLEPSAQAAGDQSLTPDAGAVNAAHSDGRAGGAPEVEKPSGPQVVEDADGAGDEKGSKQDITFGAEYLQEAATELGLTDPGLLEKVSVQGVRWSRRTPGREHQHSGVGGALQQEAGQEDLAVQDGMPRTDGGDVREEVGGLATQGGDAGAGPSRVVDSHQGGQQHAVSSSARLYTCSVCGLQAQMTPVQILQHKRSHAL